MDEAIMMLIGVVLFNVLVMSYAKLSERYNWDQKIPQGISALICFIILIASAFLSMFIYNQIEEALDKPSEITTVSSNVVYYTPKGKSYHLDRNCPTLQRSKNILSAPINKNPKDDACDVCAGG